MATYEYKCLVCNESLTIERSILDDDPGYNCESCGMKMNKVYSIGNPVFKGSGFYSKDK